MYFYFKYYKKKGIIRNIIKGYIGNEEFSYMMKEYIDICDTLETNNKILVMDMVGLELIKSEVKDMYCEFLRNLGKEKWRLFIMVMPTSMIGLYQLKKFVKSSGTDVTMVNNRKEAINEIKGYTRKEYLNCI